MLTKTASMNKDLQVQNLTTWKLSRLLFLLIFLIPLGSCKTHYKVPETITPAEAVTLDVSGALQIRSINSDSNWSQGFLWTAGGYTVFVPADDYVLEVDYSSGDRSSTYSQTVTFSATRGDKVSICAHVQQMKWFPYPVVNGECSSQAAQKYAKSQASE